MDRDKVAQKFQELWSAVTEEHAQHQTLYVGQKEDGRLTSRNTPEGKQSVMDNMKEQRNQIRQEEAENAAKKHAAEFYGGKDRVTNAAQHDHERKMAGNYEQRIPTRDYGANAPPTLKTYTVWEALERAEKARDGLHGTINELNARLEGVLTPEEPSPVAGTSPGGIGVAFRLGLNAASVEDAIYRLRGIINRLTL